uniref:Uncharacterized protein n=1 Tax=Steinernema glaseri TaxID=37863 RepID=A0A1I7ZFN7_9BILA
MSATSVQRRTAAPSLMILRKKDKTWFRLEFCTSECGQRASEREVLDNDIESEADHCRRNPPAVIICAIEAETYVIISSMPGRILVL